MTLFLALLCVLGIAAGQILFKLSALAMQQGIGYRDPKGLGLLAVALLLYAVTTLAWVWVLQRAELGRIYPLMALAFALVPLASHWLLGERFTPQYFVGVALIMMGIVVAVRS